MTDKELAEHDMIAALLIARDALITVAQPITMRGQVTRERYELIVREQRRIAEDALRAIDALGIVRE